MLALPDGRAGPLNHFYHFGMRACRYLRDLTLMTEKILQLQAHVSAVQPLLVANLSAAHTEWMAGTLARGAYEYCLQRNSLAIALTSRPAADLDELEAFKAGAVLFMDLPYAVKDVPADRREGEQAKVDALRAFYVQNGYTEVHPFLKIPVRPSPALVEGGPA